MSAAAADERHFAKMKIDGSIIRDDCVSVPPAPRRAAPRRAARALALRTGHGTWRELSPLLPLLLLLVGSWAGVPGLGSARRHLYYMISTLPAREGTSPQTTSEHEQGCPVLVLVWSEPKT